MEKGINTEKDFEIAKKIAHVLSGDCSEENRSSFSEWLPGLIMRSRRFD